MDPEARCPDCNSSKFHLLIDDDDPNDISAFSACFDCGYQESAICVANSGDIASQ